MEIKTKFNEGDTLFTIDSHKVSTGTVKEINIEVKEGKTAIKYWAENESGSYFFAYDQYSFETKEELIDSL